MTIHSFVTFVGNIDRAGVHYRVVAKQQID